MPYPVFLIFFLFYIGMASENKTLMMLYTNQGAGEYSLVGVNSGKEAGIRKYLWNCSLQMSRFLPSVFSGAGGAGPSPGFHIKLAGSWSGILYVSQSSLKLKEQLLERDWGKPECNHPIAPLHFLRRCQFSKWAFSSHSRLGSNESLSQIHSQVE